MKTFVTADCHGAHKALVQVFERSKFDYNKDRLIFLGDACDGYPETKECINELLKVKNLIYVTGNHCLWLLDWATSGYVEAPNIWVGQGGRATMDSYRIKWAHLDGVDEYFVPEEHINLLRDSYAWYKEDNNIFVHGGINPNQKNMYKQDIYTLTWDRDLFYSSHDKHYGGRPNYKYGNWDNIFIGHTTTQSYGSLKPLHCCNVWALDTGAGWNGKLTIMDLETKEYWQSDLTPSLYDGIQGRK